MNGQIINDLAQNFKSYIPEQKRIIVATDPPYNIGLVYWDDNTKDTLSDEEYITLLSHFRGMDSIFIHYPEQTIQYLSQALGTPDKCVGWRYNLNTPKNFRLCNFYNIKPNFERVRFPYQNPNDKRIKRLRQQGSLGRRSYDWFDDINIVKNVSKEKSEHPCPVPINLFIRLIAYCIPKDITFEEFKQDTVFLDPFFGSGSLGIACELLGLEWIGIERSHAYCEIAKERIKHASRYRDKAFMDMLELDNDRITKSSSLESFMEAVI